MVCIVGELYQSRFVVGFLEKYSEQWTGHGQTFVVSQYLPYFVELSLDQCREKKIKADNKEERRYCFTFTSQSGVVRRGYIRDQQDDAYIVSCNNTYIMTSDDPKQACTIWHQLEAKPAAICFHLGDQIYADRVYFRWFTHLYKLEPGEWTRYEDDIKKEYYREYYETWHPLKKFLSRTSNIMIPDDHEIKDQATLWSVYLDSQGEISYDNVKKMLFEISGKETEFSRDHAVAGKETKLEKKKQLEQFLFLVAHEVCQVLYLGLRLTNQNHFDYFRNFEACSDAEGKGKDKGKGCSIVMTERITEPFLGPEYRDNFSKMDHQPNMLWMGGLPPVMILPNKLENIAYGDGNDEKEEDFNQMYHDLFQCRSSNIICVGGDLHAGAQGYIHPRHQPASILAEKSIKFHIASPSSGFPSSYLKSDCIGSTKDYDVEVEEFHGSWANAVYANWSHGNLVSRHIYNRHGTVLTMFQNGMVTGASFWS